MSTPDAPTPPTFNPDAPHQQRPKLRPVRGFGAQMQGPDGNPMPAMGLADARQISSKVVFTQPAMQAVLPLMNGEHGLDQIVEQIGRGLTRPVLESFVAQLDEGGLLEGPTFDELWEKVKADFDSSDTLPPGQSAAFGDQAVSAEVAQAAGQAHLTENPEDREGAQKVAQEAAQALTEDERAERAPAAIRKAFDQWMDKAVEQAQDPSFESLPKGIMVPHLPYVQGWVNYASVYARLRVADRPDRVLVLGTNNFGSSTGICLCDKAFETPLGVSPADTALIEKLKASLGEAATAHRFDHEREHSIELQVPWIQHVFGDQDGSGHIPLTAVLVHDPIPNNGESYDGNGVGLDAFVEAARQALGELGGKTLVIISHELSHAGPAFGDQQPLMGEGDAVEQARNQIVNHDRQMVQLLIDNKPEELVSSLAWQQNPTRWSSTGAIVAGFQIAQPESFRMLNYAAAVDPQGAAMVSSVAASMD